MKDDKELKRGFSLVMSEELFSMMVGKFLGLEHNSILVRHVTGEHWNRSFKISALAYDDRFPVLVEGTEYPLINPIFEYVEVSDKKYEVKMSLFEGDGNA